MSADEKAIRSVIERWMEATKRQDAEAVLELMTEDVVFLVPGQPPFGKEELAKALEAQKGMTFDGTSDVQEIIVTEDWAFVRSELTVKATMPDGKIVDRAGPTLSVFYRGVDGNWRLARDANLLSPR